MTALRAASHHVVVVLRVVVRRRRRRGPVAGDGDRDDERWAIVDRRAIDDARDRALGQRRERARSRRDDGG